MDPPGPMRAVDDFICLDKREIGMCLKTSFTTSTAGIKHRMTQFQTGYVANKYPKVGSHMTSSIKKNR